MVQSRKKTNKISDNDINKYEVRFKILIGVIILSLFFGIFILFKKSPKSLGETLGNDVFPFSSGTR